MTRKVWKERGIDARFAEEFYRQFEQRAMQDQMVMMQQMMGGMQQPEMGADTTATTAARKTPLSRTGTDTS